MKKITFIFILALFCNNALSFSLMPVENLTYKNSKNIYQSILQSLTYRTHEAILEEAVTDKELADALKPGIYWNDVMPMVINGGKSRACKNRRITIYKNPVCYFGYISDAEYNIENNQGTPRFQQPPALIYRSHFGDLSFLHSMASDRGELSITTQSLMIAWAKFAFLVAKGEVATSEVVYGNTKIPSDISGLFKAQGDKYTVKYLFTACAPDNKDTECMEVNDEKIKKIAIGSVLHMIQDSYSTSHTCRASINTKDACKLSSQTDYVDSCANYGQKQYGICQYYYYVGQNSSAHSKLDHPEGHAEAVIATRTLTDLYVNPKYTWENVESYFKKEVIATQYDYKTSFGRGLKRFFQNPLGTK